MAPAQLDVLAARLHPGSVSLDPADRSRRISDQWPPGWLRAARGDASGIPDAVVFPGSTDDVATVLAWAAEAGATVVPRGGGSGVCGGAEAGPGSVVLDLSRMDRVLDVDPTSLAVHVEAGARGDRLEAALEPLGLTTGHYPQSLALSTVGGWIASSSAGQASAGYGSIEDILLGVTAVLAGGEVIRLRPVPRSAAGPDLRRLLVGSEGTLAVVTAAVLACAPRPRALDWLAIGLPSFDATIEALRAIAQAGVGALVTRGYDEPDAMLTFAPMGHAGGCAAVVAFDADGAGARERRRASADLARGAGGVELPSAYGDHWWQHRNDSTGLYERIMGPGRILGPGVVVDAMEVAGLWRGLPALYRAVREALLDRVETVGCHLSHPYRSGSSLYFTFLLRGANDYDAEARYLRAWEAAVAACFGAGGTMTHHHGVGRLKSRFMDAELGAGGMRMLRSLKGALDPMGLLNPGTLLP